MIDLTPLEVRQKKGDFRHALRGYDPELVNDFLDLVADRLEDLVKENMALREAARSGQDELAAYRHKEQALSEALMAAQRVREDARNHAEKERELVIREAQVAARTARAEAIRHIAREEEALRQVRARRAHLVESFRRLLERELRELAIIEEALELKGGVVDEVGDSAGLLSPDESSPDQAADASADASPDQAADESADAVPDQAADAARDPVDDVAVEESHGAAAAAAEASSTPAGREPEGAAPPGEEAGADEPVTDGDEHDAAGERRSPFETALAHAIPEPFEAADPEAAPGAPDGAAGQPEGAGSEEVPGGVPETPVPDGEGPSGEAVASLTGESEQPEREAGAELEDEDVIDLPEDWLASLMEEESPPREGG